MANQEVINRGKAAKELLKSDTFALVTEELAKQSFDDWVKTEPADAAAREDLYYLQLALGMIQAKLRIMVENGLFETAKLAAEEETSRKQQVTPVIETVDE